jgi:hypothetical protein
MPQPIQDVAARTRALCAVTTLLAGAHKRVVGGEDGKARSCCGGR